jgi:RNA polymerase sigma-54 factor
MLKQSLSQKLLQKLSPQQIQLMKLLQLPTIALEQRIKEEMEVNPALEEGAPADIDEDPQQDEDDSPELDDAVEASEGEDEIKKDEFDNTSDDDIKDRSDNDFDVDDYITDEDVPYYKTAANNNSSDEERTEMPYGSSATFQESLLSQLGMVSLNEKHNMIAKHLIGSLDEDGYLRRDLNSIVNDLAFTQNINTNADELLQVLQVIQTFDPPGVGARNLQECLLLQLQRKNKSSKAVSRAIEIIKNYMDEFSRKHYEKIARMMNLPDEYLKEAMNEILKLNPRPGGDISAETKSVQHIVPDFIITNTDGQLELTLNSRNAPELRISREYSEMMEGYARSKKQDRSQKEAILYLKQKIDSAKWFIDAIKQRQATLLHTMQAIMNYQRDYFLEGDEKLLKPMILKDIADVVGLDISTVSRVANSKYVQTPFGTFLIKTFFSEGMATDSGEEVSTREVKKILSDAIEGEDKRKPLPDDKLAKILKDKGYNVARRTIAKYREQLNIPVARLRKEF